MINEGSVEIKKLNLFQRIERFFGLNYQETHLKVVAVKAQALLFNSHPQDQKLKLERLIFRAQELKKFQELLIWVKKPSQQAKK